jgi:hypothetical protein
MVCARAESKVRERTSFSAFLPSSFFSCLLSPPSLSFSPTLRSDSPARKSLVQLSSRLPIFRLSLSLPPHEPPPPPAPLLPPTPSLSTCTAQQHHSQVAHSANSSFATLSQTLFRSAATVFSPKAMRTGPSPLSKTRPRVAEHSVEAFHPLILSTPPRPHHPTCPPPSSTTFQHQQRVSNS